MKLTSSGVRRSRLDTQHVHVDEGQSPAGSHAEADPCIPRNLPLPRQSHTLFESDKNLVKNAGTLLMDLTNAIDEIIA